MSVSLFNPITFDGLVEQMTDVFLDSIDTTRPVSADDVTEGSELRGIFEGVAAPLEELNFQIYIALPLKLFLDQATGSDLDRLVANFTFGQVVRIPASVASGPIRYGGSTGSSVVQNVTMQSPLGVKVFELATVTIPPAAIAVVGAGQASVAGAAGNLTVNTVLSFDSPQTGIASAFIDVAWTGGADEQSDDSLRQSVVDFLDSLSRATRAALVFGASKNGYDRCVVIEPNTGRATLYVDDGGVFSPAKIAAALADMGLNWKAAGVELTIVGPVDHPVPIAYEAFTDGSVTKVTLQAGIEAAWASLFGSKRMGDTLGRLELLAAAAAVAGFNGVNIETPAVDLVLKTATNQYWTSFSDAGTLFPYERTSLGSLTRL